MNPFPPVLKAELKTRKQRPVANNINTTSYEVEEFFIKKLQDTPHFSSTLNTSNSNEDP